MEVYYYGTWGQQDAFTFAWDEWKRGRKVTIGRNDKGVWSVTTN